MVEKDAVGAFLNLMNLCCLMGFCLMTASMSLFLDKCFQKGMIFRKYYNLIAYWFWLPKRLYKVIKCEPYAALGIVVQVSAWQAGLHYWRPIPAFKTNKLQWLFKILGGCIYCFGTWVYIITFLITSIFIMSSRVDSLALFGFLGIGLNYFFIEVILKIKK
jgi:hypothetical protein